MAYNYFPATYQNPYYQAQFSQPQFQQPQMAQPQFTPPVPQPVQQNGIIWVNSDAEVEAYPIAPNNAVRLWHSSLPIVYFKSADASGKPTIKAYDLHERAQNAPAGVSAQGRTEPAYASQKDVEALAAEIEAIKRDVSRISRDTKRREVNQDDE